MRLHSIFFLLVLLFINSKVLANVSPSDGEYFLLHDPNSNYDFIFSSEYRSFLPQIIKKNQVIQKVFQKEYNWVLDDKTSLTIASSHNQVPNAFATVIPYTSLFFYGGGASLIDMFASKSWITDLLIHENAHLYQLNPKQGLAKSFRTVFGNNLVMFPVPPLWVFLSPNVLLPRWILEGNAVLNESRFGNGGRLYSGEQRALFYALVNSDLLTEERITNSHLSFPGGREKYIVGGYFSLFLAKKYGVAKTNSFFFQHGTHYINPLLISSSFAAHFGKNYTSLFYEFLSKIKRDSKNQKVSSKKAIATSIGLAPMNKQNGKIYALIAIDGKSYPKLLSFDLKTSTYNLRSIDLPMGKVFKLPNKGLFSAASGVIDNRDTLYTLWAQNGHYHPDFLSKIVLDIKKDSVLYFHAQESYDEPHLYLNKQFKGVCHSSAILDGQNNFYCFKQHKKKRTLFKNSTPLISFNGYYSKVVDISTSGEIFFIATTEFGSSLFSYKNRTVSRLSNLDTIVDAKKISKQSFLINEVTSSGYQYKIITTQLSLKTPFNVSYFFEQHPEFKLFDNVSHKQSSLTKEKSYNHMRNIRYSKWDLMYSFYDQQLNLSTFWIDPLNQNNFSAFFEHTKTNQNYHGYDQGEFTYINSRFIINWLLSLHHTSYDSLPNDYLQIKDETYALFLLKWPYLKYGDIFSSLSGGIKYTFNDSNKPKYQLGLSLKKDKSFPLSFLPYRSFSVSAQIDIEDNRLHSKKSKGHIVYDLWKETIFSTDFEYVLTKQSWVTIDDKGQDDIIPHRHYTFKSSKKNRTESLRIGTSLTKVINYGVYFSTFPVALRRFAPIVIGNFYHNNVIERSIRSEYGIGVDFELLIAHIAPIRLRFDTLKSNLFEDETSYSLKLRALF